MERADVVDCLLHRGTLGRIHLEDVADGLLVARLDLEKDAQLADRSDSQPLPGRKDGSAVLWLNRVHVIRSSGGHPAGMPGMVGGTLARHVASWGIDWGSTGRQLQQRREGRMLERLGGAGGVQ